LRNTKTHIRSGNNQVVSRYGLEFVVYDGTDSACGASETKFIFQAVLYTSLPRR